MAPLPKHVVVDGSNIATEGRAAPSLQQLDESVRAFIHEHPGHTVTVVVDATFGHRIDPGEVASFDAAVDNNEIVSPPAGAIGRGDAFVLQIANKAGAMILSNDSFQEFHGEYPWLFDEGRLMGGKPVPHVGWVFVLRTPVRGPASRRAVRDAKKSASRGRKETAAAGAGEAAAAKAGPRPSKEASAPMPVPKVPPPGRRRKGEPPPAAAVAEVAPSAVALAEAPDADAAVIAGGRRGSGKPPEPVNEPLPFLEFVPRHRVGSTLDATVDSFSSHGAYVVADGVRCYVPLRYLGDPAPRSAREVLSLGETRSFVVVSFNPARRGVDVALPGIVSDLVEEAAPAARKPAKATKKAAKAAKLDKAAKAKAPAKVEKAAEPAKPEKAAKKPAKADRVDKAVPAPAAPAKKAAKKAAKPPAATKAAAPARPAKAAKPAKAADLPQAAPVPAAAPVPVKKAVAAKGAAAPAKKAAPAPAAKKSPPAKKAAPPKKAPAKKS